MTFNEGMRIDTSRTSVGGGGGRGIAIGGGLGGLAIVLLALFLGVDPDTVLPAQPMGPSSGGQTYDLTKCKTGADANRYEECRVVATDDDVRRALVGLRETKDLTRVDDTQNHG